MPVGETSQSVGPSRQNLLRVWSIRSILIVALLGLLTGLRWISDVELPWRPLLAVLLVASVVNGALLYRFRMPWPVGEGEFFANLLLDIGLLTAVLYLTGGSSNPLVSYYLIPLIISAAVLRPRYTWAIAALTIGCYTVLFFAYRPQPLFDMSGHGNMMRPHYVGMWINFAFSAMLIAWFVVRMAVTMREQDQAIARNREEGMRNEQIISVASIAAGAAHELRTPLATMTVLADELRSDHPEIEAEMALLQGQLERCDAILVGLLSATADGAHRRPISVRDLVDTVLDRWSLARPEVRLEFQVAPDVAGREVEADVSLVHALLNFLNNAADASPGEVRLAALPDGDRLLILVEDRGLGIPPDIVDSLGKRYISRKEGGLGLGVLLSSASIERLDGQVALLDRPGGGARLEIRLPLAAIES